MAMSTSSATVAHASGWSARTVAVAPRPAATLSGWSSRSFTMTSAAQARRSAVTTSSPMGPAPVTRIRLLATSDTPPNQHP